jgi:hypothetical protein
MDPNRGSDEEETANVACRAADRSSCLRLVSAGGMGCLESRCPDFEDTHEEWEREALKTFQRIQRDGIRVEKVEVDQQSFLRWCSEQNRPRNGESRAHYASELLRRSTETRRMD